ncbi:cell division protein FtsQ/DivIB [Mangrovicoccus ximenensis]|uniref:cell division protein FtsQ/DivIB n=1 Tax=Mangrovicoccus ximenensis TaxID=1911570 RepID=UPI000D36641A|nr:hypothetical protein [Mangrovicoccus ximenensis]
MCAVKAPRDDYAPSRIAYRVNRLWLSPVFRISMLWLLPMGVIGGGIGLWASQPGSQELITNVQVAVMARMRDQPDFQVKQMAVKGASPELTREIRRVLDLEFPVSVLDLDLDEIRVKVTAFDAVEHVNAHVVLGGALMLEITQRQPVVIWRTARGLALLDEGGMRVAVAETRDAAPELPLKAGWYGARIATFWAFLASSPMWLFRGLVAAMAGPGTALDLVTTVALAGWLALWVLSMRAAARPGPGIAGRDELA